MGFILKYADFSPNLGLLYTDYTRTLYCPTAFTSLVKISTAGALKSKPGQMQGQDQGKVVSVKSLRTKVMCLIKPSTVHPNPLPKPIQIIMQ